MGDCTPEGADHPRGEAVPNPARPRRGTRQGTRAGAPASPGGAGTVGARSDRARSATTGHTRPGVPAAPDVPGSPAVSAAAAALVAAASGAGPGSPLGSLRGLVQVSGRLVVGGPRTRGIAAIDVVEFTAACPRCGADTLWIEEREETRLRISVECPCGRPGPCGEPDDPDPAGPGAVDAG